MTLVLDHDACRQRVLDGEVSEAVLAHLAGCPGCADLAARVASVRRLAPELGAAAPAADLPARVMKALHAADTAPPPAFPPPPFPPPALPRVPPPAPPLSPARRRRPVLRPLLSAAAVVAVIVGLVIVDPGANDAEGGVSNALLASARRTAAQGTARLRLDGRTELLLTDGSGGPARPVTVTFGGSGQLGNHRLHYRGTSHAVSPSGRPVTLAPYEVTVIGNEGWMRRPDGSWWSIPAAGADHAAGGAAVAGPLAPLVLDAGSVLELLRLPKESLRDLGSGGEISGEAVRHLRFTVRPAPSLRYQVDAWVGAQDQLLRQLAMASTGTWTGPDGSVVRWRSSGTVRLFGFGERVVITKPDAALVRAAPVDRAGPEAVLFPFDWRQ